MWQSARQRKRERKEIEMRVAGGESKRKTRVEKRSEDNPVRARWNENAVTRNKRGDPKLLVEVQPEGLGMSLRRGGDETLP